MEPIKKRSLQFIILLGLVSLFADITYEGARSITGPFLSILGASGFTVGLIVGLGELVGYALRGISGYFSDKTQKYWFLTIFGYTVNLLALPLLALTNNIHIAFVLIILERFGKAIRVPPRDAMLSYATKQTGRGWGFGMHEALDQIGAILGPLSIALTLAFKESYQFGFAILSIPAIIALIVLGFARITFPHPHELEEQKLSIAVKGFPKIYWLYIFAVGLVAAGYADFALIAYHFQKEVLLSPNWIPIFYAIAMGVDGIAALIIGKIFDLRGISILAIITAISALFAPFVFLGNFSLALIGIILWGIGMGSQESIMRAIVAVLVEPNKRGSAYGLLNLVFGLFWAAGSFLMGFLYDHSLYMLVIFSMIIQLAAVPIFFTLRTKKY